MGQALKKRSGRSWGENKCKPVARWWWGARRPHTRTEPAWAAAGHPKSWRAVWQYSKRRAVRDNQTLNAQEARARQVVDGGTAPKSTRFHKTTAVGLTLDTASLDRARSLVGLKGYVTNIPATLMDSAR